MTLYTLGIPLVRGGIVTFVYSAHAAPDIWRAYICVVEDLCLSLVASQSRADSNVI